MRANIKHAGMKIILICVAAMVVSLVLLIPGVLAYKWAHGVVGLNCAVLFAGYLATWAILIVLLTTFRKHSAAWGVLFGFCFYGLLYLNWNASSVWKTRS